MDFILKETVVSDNKVQFICDYPDFFKKERGEYVLFAEYDFSLEDIPKSILNVVFVCNFFPYATLSGCNIVVDELDKSFYDGFPDVLKGYRELYENDLRYSFSCELKVKKLVENSRLPKENKNLIAFTGGVDATSAVASYADGDNVLANIWGSDIKIENVARYTAQKEYHLEFAKKFNYGYCAVKSNFRDAEILNPSFYDGNIWVEINYVPDIIGLLIPCAYHFQAKRLVLSSSYARKTCAENKIKGANYFDIVNGFKFANSFVEQGDADLDRCEKIKNISSRLKKPITLLCCWESQKGLFNCCKCEKCFRTIMNITANKLNPNDFGFSVDENTYAEIEKFVKRNSVPLLMWKDIQDCFLREKDFWKKQKKVRWILNVKFNQAPKKSFFLKIKRFFILCKRWIACRFRRVFARKK